MKRKIKFVCVAVKWRDNVNGNTYHSVRITRISDGEQIAHRIRYGYGDMYRTTALETLREKKWIRCKKENLYSYERENGYPILWIEQHGLKWECVENGRI